MDDARTAERSRLSVAVRHISCQEVVELVNDYLEHALDVADTSVFEQHLSSCDGCGTYVDQMRVTVDAVGHVGHVGEEEPPVETRDRLLTALRDWKRA
jgi:hypothetical protein